VGELRLLSVFSLLTKPTDIDSDDSFVPNVTTSVSILAHFGGTFASLASRLFPTIPPAPYLCFYPMDRKRGEQVNWYSEPIADRRSMMHEHGMIGRRYADSVRQIITGSIGLDDWEWGVDLFASDPVVFKKLIYEMRFDKVSAVYATFGQFFLSVRVPATNAAKWFEGELADAQS